MGGHIWKLLAILALFILATAEQEDQTRLIYFVEHEDEQEQDYIQITLEIEAQSSSLVNAISTAGKVAGQVKQLASAYCKEYTKKGKGDCKQAIEIQQFQIVPQYQIIRKESAFSTFIVSREVTVKVFNPENIGYLVDSFLKYPQLTLKEFAWLPFNEVDPEEAAVKQGVEQGQDFCEQVGLVLERIIDIEEIEEPVAEEEEEQEEEEDPAEITIYRFEVECAKPKKK